MAVYLVKQQSSTVLLQRLRAKGIRNPDHSRALSMSICLFVFFIFNVLIPDCYGLILSSIISKVSLETECDYF